MLDLTPTQMLDLWKQLLHLQPVRRNCSVERDDGIDLDSLLLTHINRWYAHLLLTAPPSLLPVEDVAQQVTLQAESSGAVIASLPAHCVRPVEWRLNGWLRSVTHFPAPNEAPARHHNVWTQGGCHQPAAEHHGDHLVLYSAPTGSTPTLATARCVVRPANGHYQFDQSLIPENPPEI